MSEPKPKGIEISRRKFLRLSSAAALGWVLAACTPIPAQIPGATETLIPPTTPLPLTGTPIPLTKIPAPTSIQPTLTPTETSTLPAPMIEVGGLKIPDPKASNPELFDITKPDSPIVQFANAFGVKPEDVGNLTPQLLTGVDGKQFVVLTTEDLAATANFDETGTSLLMAEQGKNGEWVWSEATPRKLMDIFGKTIGVFANPQYDHPGIIFSNNFNSVEAGAFSWDWVRRNGPDISTADFSLADSWVNFALQNKMSVMNGNPLVYHHGLPDWLTKGNFSKDELTKIMTDQIKATVGRYAGKGITWEVLNEAVWYYQGSSGYAGTIWSNTIGEKYIDIAFQAAREADPSAKLIYNDFTNIVAGEGSEISGPKADVVFNFVKDLKQKGLVDGVGLQLHMFNPKTVPSEEEIISQIKRYKDIGVDVYFTEVDVNIKPLIKSGMPLQEALQKQAEIYQRIISACVKSASCKAIYIGGLDDSNQLWPEPDTQALLFSSGVPKPAFFGVMRGITNV